MLFAGKASFDPPHSPYPDSAFILDDLLLNADYEAAVSSAAISGELSRLYLSRQLDVLVPALEKVS